MEDGEVRVPAGGCGGSCGVGSCEGEDCIDLSGGLWG